MRAEIYCYAPSTEKLLMVLKALSESQLQPEWQTGSKAMRCTGLQSWRSLGRNTVVKLCITMQNNWHCSGMSSKLAEWTCNMGPIFKREALCLKMAVIAFCMHNSINNRIVKETKTLWCRAWLQTIKNSNTWFELTTKPIYPYIVHMRCSSIKATSQMLKAQYHIKT